MLSPFTHDPVTLAYQDAINVLLQYKKFHAPHCAALRDSLNKLYAYRDNAVDYWYAQRKGG